jgi:MFS superfamily sulfate permease-like transporter
MNLLVLLGAMPNCHGAGGLAGQYKFGARHGSSVVFLGSCKVLLAVLFGKYILTFLEHIPSAILGVMLVISGQELASAGLTSLFVPLSRVGDSNNVGGTSRSSLEIALITAIIIIGLKKTHVGALVGILLDVLQKFRQTRLQSAVSSSGNAPAYYDPVQTSS